MEISVSIIALEAFNDNYIWVIINEKNHTMVCVDPGDATPVIEYAKINHLTLSYILVTHHHYDHAGGLKELIETFPGVIIFGPQDERIPLVNHVVKDEDVIHIPPFDFRILSIPGHTSTHICYQEPSNQWVFCGDTLFSGGCGRVFDGTMEQLYNSLQTLKALPDNTLVYCAHEYTRDNLRFAASIEPQNETITSYQKHLEEEPNSNSLPSKIGLEKRINPFLRTHEPSLAYISKQAGLDPKDSFKLFAYLRQQKDAFQ
jgi:hydroxyacylglutathione hydrolase